MYAGIFESIKVIQDLGQVISKGISVEDFHQLTREGKFDKSTYVKKLPSEHHVWDENASVKWNRDKTEAVAKEIQSENDALYSKIRILKTEAILVAYSTDYKMTRQQVQKVFDYAYMEGHSSGDSEIVNIMGDLMDLFKSVNDCEE